jgi:hypothetical protein
MKLRIKGSSLRLRLTQAEVQQLATEGEVAEQVHFGAGATLTYRLYSDLKNSQITAAYGDNVIDIRIPEKVAVKWCRSEQVTLVHAEPLPVGQGELRIVIEKDFACLAPRPDEDESDNFPHPSAAAGHKSC